ncbi:alpha/beta hydrolase [Panacibacter ginsenosidivorans]|uniref:Alpha/beta hydrolase n=1 Tax=Panacibacter ginsenosidivorans TaxID=1813871 RepID=A0A5B8VEU2_9BACT|nr:alpha/beta hydrolase [Panacibacter ginsenosidivorans]QEC69829.1 alpha/beta hydrolase [Panacibacter ginsenosidivorans]
MKKLLSVLFIFIAFYSNAQTVIPLYNGAAPGSENWNWDETQIKADIGTIISDVSHPSITAYVPANPNGTAVIIAPGGAFHVLAFDLEGTEVAKRLNAKGIIAFVLKYRVVHNDPAHPENSIGALMSSGNFKKLDSLNAPVVPLAMQDGLTAVKYVREHAAEYKIDPNKIGFMGFSAGGTVTMSVVYSATDESRPNFVAPIYAYEKAIIGSIVPSAKTPIFITAASDDDLGLATHSVHIYLKWLEAKQPAELHMYEQGKHGFGTKKQGLPVDAWMDRFADWLAMHNLIK